jgi:molecular chaperone GrpE
MASMASVANVANGRSEDPCRLGALVFLSERFILATMTGERKRADGPRDEDRSADEREAEPSSGTGSVGSSPEDGPPSVDASDPLAAAQAEAARMKDAWLRSAADFDNFRKRTRRELEDARRGGREDLLKAIMPVFDNLERAIQSAQRAADVKAVADGLSMVQRQFVDALGREGITRVPTVGRPFDPGVHEAIQQVETADHAPGTVIAEVQPGYTQGDKLVRAAMVVVAKAKSEDGTAPNSNEAAS